MPSCSPRFSGPTSLKRRSRSPILPSRALHRLSAKGFRPNSGAKQNCRQSPALLTYTLILRLTATGLTHPRRRLVGRLVAGFSYPVEIFKEFFVPL